MALGGWIYHTLLIPSFTHTNDTLYETNVVDPMISLIAGISGWSVAVGKTKYFSDSGWYAEFSHSGGAHLAVVWVGDTTSGTTYIHADNMIHGVGQAGADLRRVMFSYWPPGHSGAGAANPSLSGYVPSDGIGFMWGSRHMGISSGNTNRFQFMARGDDLIVVSEFNSELVDAVSLMGTIVEPLHSSDSGSRSGEAMVLRWSNAYASTSRHFGCFADDNTTRIWYDPPIIDNYTWLTSSINSAAPWSWVPCLLARPLYAGASGLASGVTSGSGIKGRVNPEVFRWTVQSGGPSNKQQLVSGNLIHVAEGVVLGWDSSNGAMS